MSDKQVRVGQLIAPFGPGSLYTDRQGTPLIVCGLDYWFKKADPASKGDYIDCDDKTEFFRFDRRLSELLRVQRFCIPPDYRWAKNSSSAPPPNSGLKIPAHRFPTWYRNTQTGRLKRFSLETTAVRTEDGGKGRWQPVRFLATCRAGHICDFPWKEWIQCSCADDGELELIDRGGSDLQSIKVKCHSCPDGSSGRLGRSLSGVTFNPTPNSNERSALESANIKCPGSRPWLGSNACQNCEEPLVGALTNQTNLYFPRILSAISLPEIDSFTEPEKQLISKIEADQSALSIASSVFALGGVEQAVPLIQLSLDKRSIDHSEQDLPKLLTKYFQSNCAATASPVPTSHETALQTFRREEQSIIREGIDDPLKVPNLRVRVTDVPPKLKKWFEKINLVEKLKETRVFHGFDRLMPSSDPLTNMPEEAMNQLFKDPPANPLERWLPAIEVFGEGIYLELNEQSLRSWQSEQKLWIENRLTESYLRCLESLPPPFPPQTGINHDWASRFLVTHSLAHLLITQLVFECGYSTASLRERIYVSNDSAAPMAALLIYTAAGDSEGTLGGIVQLGRPERIVDVIQRAITRASWCSADPICSEQIGGIGANKTNIAACHACILLPETSCETINQGLDRSMVVGTPEERDVGFLSGLLS